MRRSSLYPAFLACAGVIFGVLGLAMPSASVAQTQIEEPQIPFVTLRNRTGQQNPGQYYGDERSDLKAGWCRVKSLDVSVLGALAEAAPGFIREEFLSIDRVTETGDSVVFDALQQTVGDDTAVIYVHGFNISFEKGCRRALLLRQNAGLNGRLLWFSWPSDGTLTNYMRDESDMYWSVPDLAEVILEMERRFGPDKVSVVGHSLGARGVVLALYEVANRRPDIRLGEVVLLAPDMDFQFFERLLPRVRPVASNLTIYVTQGDRPLALSEQLHGYPRLGEAGNDVSRLDDVEVIDISDLSVRDLTGHLYHIYNAALGADLRQLLNEAKAADARENLTPAGPNLWRLGEAQPD